MSTTPIPVTPRAVKAPLFIDVRGGMLRAQWINGELHLTVIPHNANAGVLILPSTPEGKAFFQYLSAADVVDPFPASVNTSEA